MAADEAFGFEFGVGVGDGGAVDAQLRREFAARGDALAGTQISAMHQRANLVAQLDIERNVTLGLKMEWQSLSHPISPIYSIFSWCKEPICLLLL